MSKFTFIKEPDPDNWMEEGDSKLTLTCSAIQLDDIILEFENFLKGSGFYFEGHLDFVQDEIFETDEDDLDNVDQFFGKAKEVAKKLDGGNYID
jgi:hypothetical protein